MAKNKSVVYLAFEDEEITTKHMSLMNSTVNKVGGKPDWPATDIKVQNCPICNSLRPLLVQLYAPLDNSQFHRTLYVFACLNPACSVASNAWICLRTQNLDMQNTKNNPSADEKAKGNKKQPVQKMTWCSSADDWDDDAEETNQNQTNMNFANTDNFRPADNDGEDSNMVAAMGGLRVYEQNANCEKTETICKIPKVCAEIETEESGEVFVEDPKLPERNLMALLKGSATVEQRFKDPTLKSFFLAVDEEEDFGASTDSGFADHVKELYQKYKEHSKMDEDSSTESQTSSESGGDCGMNTKEKELYEKAVPAHGDLMFFNFLSAIQRNPGQLLRYSRDCEPLLIAPLYEHIPKCKYCGRDTVCEVQILSTLIPKLQLQQSSDKAPIDYGNVLVFTCLNSCWDITDNMRFESIIVQKEM